MKSIFSLVITVLMFSINSFSQENYFNQQFKFKDGIYLNFKQLIRNKPAIEMTPSLEGYFINNSIDPHIKRALKSYHGNEPIRIELKHFWAVCIRGVPMKVINMRIQYQNTTNSIIQTEPVYLLTRFSMLGKLTSYLIPKDGQEHVVNYDDLDHAYKLNRKTIVTLIKDDPELLERFNSENKKKKNLMIYISEYNHRNPVEVKLVEM